MAAQPQRKRTAAAKKKRLFNRLNNQGATSDPKDAPVLLMGSVSGYEAANNSPSRGYLWWPQGSDTRREMEPMADAEIRRRCHWLYANFGAMRRAIDGAAQFLGVQTPIPILPDEAWNKEAFEHFEQITGSPEWFDRRGRDSFGSMQYALQCREFLDGRVLNVLTENFVGGAQFMTYEAHQIKSGGPDSSRYTEGVELDSQDKHRAYCLQDGVDTRRFHRVEARDAIYCGNFESFGRIHGLPLMAHAVSNFHDVVELRGFRKHASKHAALWGVAVEQDGQTAISLPHGEAVAPILGNLLQEYVQTGRMVAAEAGSGGSGSEEVLVPEEKPITLERIVQGGALTTLKPGQRVKIVADDRPTQNNLEFERILLEDGFMGGGFPPALLYYVLGKTGPNVRMDEQQLRRWIDIRLLRRALWTRRVWTYTIAKEIKAKRLREPKSGKYWSQVLLVGSPDMTIDEGRHGQLAIARLEAGLTTWEDEWAVWGRYAPWRLEKRIREYARAKKLCATVGAEVGVEITMGEVFPKFAGQPVAGPGAGQV